MRPGLRATTPPRCFGIPCAGFSKRIGPPAAARNGPSPDDASAIWRKLIGQGVAALGSGLTKAGLREILVVMEELGRAACPAPMWSAALANLALSGSRADAAVELLEKLHAGTVVTAFSFGALDPDAGAGSIRIDGSCGTGVLRFVEAASATHLLVAVDESRLALVQLDASGIVLAPTRAMGAWGLCEVRLNSAPVTLVRLEKRRSRRSSPQGPGSIAGAGTWRGPAGVRAGRGLCQGASPVRATDRKIPGDPAQARQWPDRARRRPACPAIMRPGCTTLVTATGAISPIARLPSAATRCGACRSRPSIRFGAIGYAEEHEAAQHFKRVHLDTIALGGAPDARRRLASYLLDRGGAPLPQYDLGPAGNELARTGPGDGSIRTGRETGRRGSTNCHLKSVSSTPTSRAISARPDGSASDGRRNSAGRRVLRWSRSHSWRRWSRARHRGSARRSRPTP